MLSDCSSTGKKILEASCCSLLLSSMAFLRASRRPSSTKILLVKSLTGPSSLKWIMELSEPEVVVEAGNSSGVEEAGAAVVVVEDFVVVVDVDVVEVLVVVGVVEVVVGAVVVVVVVATAVVVGASVVVVAASVVTTSASVAVTKTSLPSSARRAVAPRAEKVSIKVASFYSMSSPGIQNKCQVIFMTGGATRGAKQK